MKHSRTVLTVILCIAALSLLIGCAHVRAYIAAYSADLSAAAESSPLIAAQETEQDASATVQPDDQTTAAPTPASVAETETQKPAQTDSMQTAPVNTSEPKQTESAAPVGTPEPEELPDTEDGFFYAALSTDQKRIYHKMKAFLDDLSEEQITFATTNMDDVYAAREALFMDYAKYYYLYDYYLDGQRNEGRVCMIRCNSNVSETKQELAIIAEETERIIAGIPENATEYETVKFFYEWLCENLSYEHSVESTRDQYITSAFIDRKTVCTGYSRALQYLCNQVGIQCTIASGEGDNGQTPPESHTWNLVRIDGTYYWTDVTWGDPIPNEAESEEHISYYFLCTTDEFLFRTHTLKPFEGMLVKTDLSVEYPKCEDESLLYSKQFGLFFDSYESTDVVNQIIAFVQQHGADETLIMQFRNPSDVWQLINDGLPNLLPKVWDAGLRNIQNYTFFFFERDGYLELTFLPVG